MSDNVVSFLTELVKGLAPKETLGDRQPYVSPWQKYIDLENAIKQDPTFQHLKAYVVDLERSGLILRSQPSDLGTCNNGHRYAMGDFYYALGTLTNTTQKIETVNTQQHSSIRRRFALFPAAYLDSANEQPVVLTNTSTRIEYALGCPQCHSSSFIEDDPRFTSFKHCDKMKHAYTALGDIDTSCNDITVVESAASPLHPQGCFLLNPWFYDPRFPTCPFCAALEKCNGQIRATNAI